MSHLGVVAEAVSARPRSARPPTVLVCDADARSVRALRVVLRDASFAMDSAGTVEEALDRAALRPPDAAIVELVLPDGDGVEVCRRLREWSAVPVIVLSTVDAEEEKVRALDAGADDYVTKPFAPRELVARLRAALRRAERAHDEPRVELDGLVVDLAARTVRRDGQDIHLTPIEFKLLRLLLRHRGRLLTQHVLMQEVWGPRYVRNTQSLRTHIANLRRKIEPADAEPLIRTDHGVGYRFADSPPRPQPLRVVAGQGRGTAALAA